MSSEQEHPDLVDLLEEEQPDEPYLGPREPDYSLNPEHVVSLPKKNYFGYNQALRRFAEIADIRKLKLVNNFDTATHYVFQCVEIKR